MKVGGQPQRDGRARRGATNAAEMARTQCWYPVSLGFPALSIAVAAADQQEHPLPSPAVEKRDDLEHS